MKRFDQQLKDFVNDISDDSVKEMCCQLMLNPDSREKYLICIKEHSEKMG